MNNLNSVLLEGHLCRDPDVGETTKGTPVCTLAVASTRSYKLESGERQEEVSFVDVKMWGKLASVCGSHLKKGRSVRVVGRLKQDRWVCGEQHHAKVLIVAEQVEFQPQRRQPVAGTEARAS